MQLGREGSTLRRVFLLLVLGTLAGCGEQGAEPGPERRCPPPEGAAPPKDIESLRLWVNALPKPTSLPCFVESLERPLDVQASLSEFSAQASEGVHSPRLFLFFEPLVLTLAPSGIGHALLEMSELESDTRSLKAELEFPVEAELAPEAPYEKALLVPNQTGCAFCHAAERLSPRITFTAAFSSEALRPAPEQRVPLSELSASAERCDAELEPNRCALLTALFAHGELREHDFPEAMPVCFPDN
jgi:hypothetical protein